MLREPSGRDTPTGLGVREAWLSEGGVSSSLNKWSPEPASGVEKFLPGMTGPQAWGSHRQTLSTKGKWLK